MATTDLTLYYFPLSYYSLKVLLALYEKNVPFKEQLVLIHSGEQNSDWYLGVNPKGEVPALKDGNENISESEVIIDYLDSKYKTEPELVPSVGTAVGQEVAEFRKFLHAIPVDQISFGLLANRQLGVTELRFPKVLMKKSNRKFIETRIDASIAGLKKKLTTCAPEVREALQGTLEKVQQRKTVILNEQSVSLILDNLDQVFDKIEERLEKSKKDASGSTDVWLFGANFCAADITTTALMCRLYMLGLDERYFSDVKRPIVSSYYKRLMKRPAVIKMNAIADTTGSVVMKNMLKTTAVKAVKVGLIVGVVALGVLGFREYFRASRGIMRA